MCIAVHQIPDEKLKSHRVMIASRIFLAPGIRQRNRRGFLDPFIRGEYMIENALKHLAILIYVMWESMECLADAFR